MSTLTRLRAKLKEALLLAQRAWRKGKMTLAMSLCVVGMAIGGLVISPNGAKATAVASSFETVKVPVSARGRQRSSGYDRTRPTILSKASVTTDKLGTQTASAATEVTEEVERSLATLIKSFQGVKLDTLIPLVATSAIIPLCKNLNLSPVLGFLAAGTLLGPSCLNWITDHALVDALGEIGIVFFLFEMGLELSVDKLIAMKKDVFGLGTSAFVACTAAGMAIARYFGGQTLPASFVIGGSMALSSSAFVLQILKDKGAAGTRYGRASFGLLLLQDIAVVPFIIIVELLGQGGVANLTKALTIAGIKALVALAGMGVVGKKLFDPFFSFVAKSGSQEAFLSITLSTVLLMSFVTQGFGLSSTLGAFCAGLLLAETRYRYQIEADIAPFRGILLGLFFISVGFSIDVNILVAQFPSVIAMLATLLIGKSAIVTAVSMVWGLEFSQAQQTALLTSQGGEFAFVAFAIAEKMGIIEGKLIKLLLTTVALSMAVTPALASLGSTVASKIETRSGLKHYVGSDSGGKEVRDSLPEKDFVVVVGYGRVGRILCEILDRRFIRYIVIDKSPKRAIDARNKGLPVFYGDVSRAEVLNSFGVASAKACVLAIDDMASTNRAVESIRRNYPQLRLIVRAQSQKHERRLSNKFDNLSAMAPFIPADSMLLTIPFGGYVLNEIGVSQPEIEAILEEIRKSHYDEIETMRYDDNRYDFLDALRNLKKGAIPEGQVKVDGDIFMQVDNHVLDIIEDDLKRNRAVIEAEVEKRADEASDNCDPYEDCEDEEKVLDLENEEVPVAVKAPDLSL
jgi:monovalent cation:proton antiporter-2 (CPA2) family protein